MNKSMHSGAYNARWLFPEQVARTFVPLASYSKLIREGHSVLMGPRGCGKTTLLKMLTRKALNEWHKSGRAQKYPGQVTVPNFETVYIPSDVRWLYEIRNIDIMTPEVNEQLQRIMITVSVLNALLDTFNSLISDLNITDNEKEKYEIKICEILIDLWRIPRAIPSFVDVDMRIQEIVANIRGLLKFNHTALEAYLQKIPPFFYSNALDAPFLSCNRIGPILPEAIRPNKWALCFDELEIAPEWLHEELLNSLRSVDQSFFLKLTWSPILPQAKSAPEPAADFTVIRLWNAHLRDQINFCEDLTKAFLSDRFPDRPISPDNFLGHSPFTKEDDREEYFNRRSSIYLAMRSLAEFDVSFRQSLIDRKIDPNDPVPSKDIDRQTKQLNEFFRKIKPIVLLRNEYLKPGLHRRTRKITNLYTGKETVYGISEGNPRRLIGLLNDLCDAIDTTGDELKIPPSKQASIIDAVSRRFIQLIKATPVHITRNYSDKSISIIALVGKYASLFLDDLYNEQFPLDPTGSIRIGEGISPYVEATIRRALEIGALVHVGRSPEDVPSQIIKERFRLSFMVCPSYKLPIRNYKDVTIKSSGFMIKTPFNKKKVLDELEQLGLGLEE